MFTAFYNKLLFYYHINNIASKKYCNYNNDYSSVLDDELKVHFVHVLGHSYTSNMSCHFAGSKVYRSIKRQLKLGNLCQNGHNSVGERWSVSSTKYSE